MQHLAFVHHHDAIAQIHGLLHGVGHHQRGYLFTGHNLVRELDHLGSALGV